MSRTEAAPSARRWRGWRRWLGRGQDGPSPAPRPTSPNEGLLAAWHADGEPGVKAFLAQWPDPQGSPADVLRRCANAAVNAGDAGAAVAIARLAHEADPTRAMQRWMCLVQARAGLIEAPAARLAESELGIAQDPANAHEWRQLLAYAQIGARLADEPARVAPRRADAPSRVLLLRAGGAQERAAAVGEANDRLVQRLAALASTSVATLASDCRAVESVADAPALLDAAALGDMPPDAYLDGATKAVRKYARAQDADLLVCEAEPLVAWPALRAAHRSGLRFVAWFPAALAPGADEREQLRHAVALRIAQRADAVWVEDATVAATLGGIDATPLGLAGTAAGASADAAPASDRLAALLASQFEELRIKPLPAAPPAEAAIALIVDADAPGDWEALTLTPGASVTLNARVDPGETLRLAFDARWQGPERPRAVVAEVRYLDDGGQDLPPPYPGCSSSARFAAYYYAPAVPLGVYGQQRRRLTVPQGASRVSVRYALFDQGEPPVVKRMPSVERIPPGDEAASAEWQALTLEPGQRFVRVMKVDGGEPILLSTAIAGSGPADPKAVVAEVRLFGADGVRHDGPVSGLASSSQFSHYLYRASSPVEAVELRHALFQPPEGLSRIEVHLQLRLAEPVTLTQAPELQPFDLAKLSQLLDEGAALDPAWLGPAAKLAQREGALTLLGRLLERWARIGGAADVVEKWRALKAELLELEPDWIPSLGVGRLKARDTGRLTVCHLHKTAYPFENSGGSIRCLNTLTSQQKIGLDPYVITPPGYPASDGVHDAPLHELVDGIEHFRIGPAAGGVRTLSPPVRTRYAALQSALVVQRRGASLIHAASGVRGFELALQGLALREAFQIPLIYEVRSFHEHTWAPAEPRIFELERTQRRIAKENRCMALADHVVTISESMRRILIERGVPPDKLDVVPNAIDVARFEGPTTAVDLPPLRGAALVLGYISNMSRREGHRDLIEALARLRAGGLDARCLLVGDGPERGHLERQAEELGLGEVVVFTGEVDHHQINGYYAAIDIFVIPRRPDYAADWVTPLKPYEAMALGRPLVVTDLPALHEVVGDGERGRIARAADSESLAEQIGALARDGDGRRAMAQRARDWVFEHRTWAANARRYADIYERVLTGYAARAHDVKGL